MCKRRAHLPASETTAPVTISVSMACDASLTSVDRNAGSSSA
jgi:hypothetical protein